MAYRATSKTRARQEARREALLVTAQAFVAEGGFAGLRMSELAAGAGLATGTVYRYFSSKAALSAEVFRRASQREVDVVREACAGPGAPRERLARAVTRFASRALHSRRLAYALLAEPSDPAVEAERLRYRRAYADVFRELIAAGGAIPPAEHDLAATWLVGALGEALVGPLARSPLDPHEEAALTAGLVRLSLRCVFDPPGGSP